MDDNEKNTRQIMNQKYYSVNDAINSTVDTKTVFIIANERIKKDGDIGRYYTVFPTFKDFLDNRDKYPHCHEYLVDHKNNKINPAGRLVFDFDIKDMDSVPDDFTRQIEKTVEKVIKNHFKNVDVELFEYVWSTSPNLEKFSKHLTVKNLYFDNWIRMSQIFYKFFCAIWKKKYYWISSDKLIDFQVVRKHASLRMVGSSKINGNVLTFDSDNYSLMDSLIRIYFRNQKEKEQLVTKDNIIDQEIFSDKDRDFDGDFEFVNSVSLNMKNVEQLDPVYLSKVYKSAFKLFSKLQPNIFSMGKINGNKLNLIRLHPHSCLLSKKYHENENAYITIIDDETVYSVFFGCYRKCQGKNFARIGSMSVSNFEEFIDPNFEHLIKVEKKSKPKKKNNNLLL